MAKQDIIFDFDGTILDTRQFIYDAFASSLTHHGLPVPDQEAMRSVVGLSLLDCYRQMAPSGDHDSLVAHHRRLHADPTWHDIPTMYPYVQQVLGTLASNSRLHILTNRAELYPLLERHKLTPYFKVIVHAESGLPHKPDRAAIDHILKQANGEHRNAWMIGDTPTDIATAKNADVRSVGITHGFGTQAELAAAGADHIVDGLDQLIDIVTHS